MVLSCGHIFHTGKTGNCAGLVDFMLKNRKTKCPYCSESIHKEKDNIKINYNSKVDVPTTSWDGAALDDSDYSDYSDSEYR